MPTITTKDGAQIFYKDWGSGQPVVFSHGWPLNADVWDEQLLLFASNGFRAIAHDRRGHGRSTQTWTGNDMDTYADDLAALVKALDLKQAIHVGHSTGGGEVVRYLGRHGTARVAKAVLVDAVPPFLLRTADNPEGLPKETYDQIRQAVTKDRSQFWKDFSILFYGVNRPGAKVSEGILDQFWRLSMQAGLVAVFECIHAFGETDFREDLKQIDVPTLVIHGEDDQVVPIAASGNRTAKMIAGATFKPYPGAPHGLMSTHQQQFNTDLLNFARLEPSERRTAKARKTVDAERVASTSGPRARR
jgi:non-heme chloroperoxidase